MLSSKPGLAGPRKSISLSVAVSPWWPMLATKPGREQVFSLVYPEIGCLNRRAQLPSPSSDNGVAICGCSLGAPIVHASLRRQRVFRDRTDPALALSDDILYERYRFSSEGIRFLIVLDGPYVGNAMLHKEAVHLLLRSVSVWSSNVAPRST
jgi:hypothetical protein